MKCRLMTYRTAIFNVVFLVMFSAGNGFAQETQTQPPQNQGAQAQGEGAGADKGKPYTVVCENTAQGKVCKVDRKTYVGWRTYHSFCYQCHAQDAVGSSFAPSLVDRLKTIPKERFYNSVMNGFKGQIGVMPAWKDNPNVSSRIDELYTYLKARSDGALAQGRPERLDEEPRTAGK